MGDEAGRFVRIHQRENDPEGVEEADSEYKSDEKKDRSLILEPMEKIKGYASPDEKKGRGKAIRQIRRKLRG